MPAKRMRTAADSDSEAQVVGRVEKRTPEQQRKEELEDKLKRFNDWKKSFTDAFGHAPKGADLKQTKWKPQYALYMRIIALKKQVAEDEAKVGSAGADDAKIREKVGTQEKDDDAKEKEEPQTRGAEVEEKVQTEQKELKAKEEEATVMEVKVKEEDVGVKEEEAKVEVKVQEEEVKMKVTQEGVVPVEELQNEMRKKMQQYNTWKEEFAASQGRNPKPSDLKDERWKEQKDLYSRLVVLKKALAAAAAAPAASAS